MLASSVYTHTFTQPQFWVRVLNNVMLAGALLLIAYCGVYFLQNKNSGHRTLIKAATVFFFMGFVHYVWSGIALLTDQYEISTLLLTGFMISSWIFAGLLFGGRRDVLYTLTTSEHQDRLFKDNLADLRTITSGLVVRAETTEQKAVAVSRKYVSESKQAS